MHPAVHLVAEHALQNLHVLLPALYVVLATVAHVHAPVKHSLLVVTVSWLLIWIPTIFRAGFWSGGSRGRKTASWLAGSFLALAQVCDRAASDKMGIWTTKGLLPALVVLLSENEFLSKHVALPSYSLLADASPDGGSNSEKRSHARSSRLLAVVTISASMVLASGFTLPSTWALGLSSVIFTAVGLILFESALKDSKDDSAGRRGLMSANGTFSRRGSLDSAQKELHLASLRDVAFVMVVLCGLATFLIEPAINPDAISWKPSYRHWGDNWRVYHYHKEVQQCLLMILVNSLLNIATFFQLWHQDAVLVSFLLLLAIICTRLISAISFSGVWFTIIFGSAAFLFIFNSPASASNVDIRSSIRFRRILLGVTAVSVCIMFMQYAFGAGRHTFTTHEITSFDALRPEYPYAPVPIDMSKGHPAHQLIKSAEKDFQAQLERQSKSLDGAVREYRRRNGIFPPPHFDKWYEFARRNGIQLIDEFDNINRSLLPFWAIKPSTIRQRVKNALGFQGNGLIGFMIRDGSIVKIEGGQEWQQQATAGMMKEFVQYLPNMDLAFNIHDEPRVVVPHDDLSILISKARDQSIPAAMKIISPRNSFSGRPADMNDGKRLEEAKTSRFNEFAHQQTWTNARMSCPANSPARILEDSTADNLTAYATEPLNYIYNYTAFTDICNSPSLAYTFGFFERPNAFNVIHELTPIFSQSKVSSFQDILYPSPWYWFGRVGYDKGRDTTWENKTNSLYWRGSTTGGFSRNGGWRRQHRQHIVRRFNALDRVKVLVRQGGEAGLEVREVGRKDYKKYVNIKFSHIGQCDPGDCDAQKEFFEVVERVDGQDAWWYKHLLDMDGNAFSGRFYAFLKSKSLTFKMALFQEWHQEWLKPWVHYVPLTLIGDEHLDLVRWFAGVEDASGAEDRENKGNGNSVGEKKAKEIAERSTEWADKVLRNVDFEAWFFRLLLEYGRIVDDDREVIGYPGP